MSFTPVRKLAVWRRLQDGGDVQVGTLAQNTDGVYFQYQPDYLSAHGNLSPFSLHADTNLQSAPRSPHAGLHGVFADSLPDGWGLLLMDRSFQRHNIHPARLTAMDRLAFVGDTGMGALHYRPASDYAEHSTAANDLHQLGHRATALFDGQTDEVLTALVAAGSSGGARPKALLYFAPDDERRCRTTPASGDEAWLVKFTAARLPLAHEEGLCEAVYLQMAAAAGLHVPEWKLLPAAAGSGASHWLATRRFDRVPLANGGLGSLHLHSACGLLDADFRSPSLDYETLIKASSMLCSSPRAGQLQFRRALFNLLAANQDDHSRNWAFLQDDAGKWRPAPFYDVTFSPHPLGEHATAFAGHGKAPPKPALQQLARAANFSSWQEVVQVIEETLDVLASFGQRAAATGVSTATIKAVEERLAEARRENSGLGNPGG